MSVKLCLKTEHFCCPVLRSVQYYYQNEPEMQLITAIQRSRSYLHASDFTA